MAPEIPLTSRLENLGFSFATDLAAGPPKLREELALREFQRYASEPMVAHVADPAAPLYADRLEAVENTDRFKDHPHGFLDSETARLITLWEKNSWRCPVVIEAWWTSWTTAPSPDPHGKKLKWHVRGRIFEDPRAQNLWLWDEGRRIQGQTSAKKKTSAAEQRVRMYAIDRSGWLAAHPAFAHLVAADKGRIVLGHHTHKDEEGQHLDGPTSAPKSGDVSFPVTPDALTGKTYAQLSAAEQITYRVVRAVCEVECLGFLDSLTCYDRAITSLGLCHWTLSHFDSSPQPKFQRGELEAFLAYLKITRPDTFMTACGRFGLQPTDAWYPKTGAKTPLVNRDQRKFESSMQEYFWNGTASSLREIPHDLHRFNMLRSWHWFYRFQVAIRVLTELPQAMWDMARFRIRDVLAVQVPVSLGIPPNQEGKPLVLGDLFQSEELVALLLEWHIWKPGTLLHAGGVPSASLIQAIKTAGEGDGAVPLSKAPKTWKFASEAKLKEGILATLKSSTIKKRLALARSVSFDKREHPTTKEKRLSLVRGSFQFSDAGPLYPPPQWNA